MLLAVFSGDLLRNFMLYTNIGYTCPTMPFAFCFILISHLDAVCLALLEICSWSLFLKNQLFASFTFHVLYKF